MIPCQDCGHDNPLGSVFCHRCGERLQVNLAQVAGSVAISRTHDRINRFCTAAGNALLVAGFLLAAALVIRHTMIPDLPPASLMPPADPDDATLFTRDAPWQAASTSLEALLPDPLPLTVHRIEGPSLQQWRAQIGLARLRSFGVDPAMLHRLQLGLLRHQNPDGSFAGSDVLTATSLAALALQAIPPPSSGDDRDRLNQAVDKAQRWLLVRVRTPGNQRQPSLGRTLATIAVLEGGELTTMERRNALLRAMDREEPLWQLIALLSCPPDERPDEVIAGLFAAMADNHVGQVLGGLLDKQRAVLLNDAAFSAAAARASTGAQALAWALAAWYRGAAPRVMQAQAQAWAESGICPPDDALLRAAPLIAEPALAILAASAPIRAPVSWVALP